MAGVFGVQSLPGLPQGPAFGASGGPRGRSRALRKSIGDQLQDEAKRLQPQGGVNQTNNLFSAVGFDPLAIQPDVAFGSQFDIPGSADEVQRSATQVEALQSSFDPIGEAFSDIPGFESIQSRIDDSAGGFGGAIGNPNQNLTEDQLRIISTQIPELLSAFEKSISRFSGLSGFEGSGEEFRSRNIGSLQLFFNNILDQLNTRGFL